MLSFRVMGHVTLEVIQRVLEAANEVGPLPEWTRDRDGAEDVLRQMQQEGMDAGKFIVGLSNPPSYLGCFNTEQEASEFISTLPDHEKGIYYLDGPERPFNEVEESGDE